MARIESRTGQARHETPRPGIGPGPPARRLRARAELQQPALAEPRLASFAHGTHGRTRATASPSPDTSAPAEDGSAPKTYGLTGLAEQRASRILKPLGLVVLSRERISDTVLEAAEEGRLTRSDAEQLASELIQRGSQQTDELLNDLDQTLDRGASSWTWPPEGSDRPAPTVS